MLFWLLLLGAFISLPTSSALAQNYLVYHLNEDNGLPSNHTYAAFTDRLGYLWVSTNKGVVKYNGYTTKLFTTAEGLPTDDIWGLLEDRKGRIWLATQSNEIGYLYNDKYYRTYLKGIKGSIFPYKMNHFDSGIIFCSGHVNNRPIQTICIEKNDTIYPFPLSRQLLPLRSPDSLGMPGAFINKQKQVLYSYSPDILQLSNFENAVYDPANLKVVHMPDTPFYIMLATTSAAIYMKNFTIGSAFNKISRTLVIINYVTNREDRIILDSFGISEPIEYLSYDVAHTAKDEFYVFTKNYILVFRVNKGIEHVATYNARQVVNNQEGKKGMVGYVSNALWGLGIATGKHGMYLTFDRADTFKHLPALDLNEYTYTGTIYDSISTWWNSELKTFVLVAGDKIVRRVNITGTGFISKVLRCGKDSLFLSGTHNYYYELKHDRITAVNVRWASNIRGVHIERPGQWLFTSLSGIFRIRMESANDPFYEQIDPDRYIDLVYDSVRKCCWAYNSNKILLYAGKEKTILTSIVPRQGESSKIEKICVDSRYGTIFIQTATSLYMYDHELKRTREISYNINLKKTSIAIYRNMLVVYGEFGILFAQINGKGLLSSPIIRYNYKKSYYSKCLSYATAMGKVMLNTNKGIYEINTPTPAEFETASAHTFTPEKRLILAYEQRMSPLHQYDTVTIHQQSRVLRLDLINPAGSGNIQYSYLPQGDTVWQRSGQGEVIIPQSFTPDNYYTISLICQDDAWKSNVIVFTVYIQPYWWQTHAAKSVFWVGGILLAILIIITVILITRRMVTRANEKKNMQMELELKAIYAQINPHFIFNTLTSALLLVSKNKMDEAYTHISKFAKLLRSYLKSSRNKYITIEDEIDNLRNYTELQQTRFKDRFTCNIYVDPLLNTHNFKIPSLLIQPFVENAINHGLLHNNKNGILDIAFTYNSDKSQIVCTITDNGIGRIQAKENKKNSEKTLDSYGNLLISDLVNIFNKYEEMIIDIKYKDRYAPDTGTIVIITITEL